MSKIQFVLLSLVLVVVLGAAAVAAPKRPRQAVPALPALSTTDPALPDAVGATAAAPVGAVQTTLFGGQALDQAGVSVAPWGGGNAQDNTALYLENGHSIQVTTIDEYQGGKITFKTPVSLGDMSKTRYLQMTLRFPKAAAPQPEPGQDGGIRRRRRRFGQGGFGTDNLPPEESPTPVITALHWVLTLADGRQTDVLRPLPQNAVNGQDWVSVAVPLSVLKFPAGAASALKSLTVAADGYSNFSIGAIRIVSDDSPITASAGVSQTVQHGNPIAFHGVGSGGASVLRYSWNFGDSTSADEEAEGQDVTTQYFTAKDYIVTLTVSDVDGVKKSATSTMTVHVD